MEPPDHNIKFEDHTLEFEDAEDKTEDTYQVIEEGTKRGRDKLVDNFGYSYNIKFQRPNITYWQCSVRPKINPCTVKVLQKYNEFTKTDTPHNHPPTAWLPSKNGEANEQSAAGDEMLLPLSGVWKHFILPDEREGKYKVMCKHCNSFLANSNKNTSNLKKHLRRKHQSIIGRSKSTTETPTTTKSLAEISRRSNPKSDVATAPRRPVTKSGVVKTAAPTTSTITRREENITEFRTKPNMVIGKVWSEKKKDIVENQQDHINDALIRFVCCDPIPFTIVESPYFKGLLHAADPSYQVPSRRDLVSDLLQEKYDNLTLNIKSRLDKVDWICVTVHIWSSRHQKTSYISITGHFIEDWQLCNVIFVCKRYQGRLTENIIMQEFDNIKEMFNIESKVTTIITNNISSACEFTLPGFRVSSLAESDDDDDSDDNKDMDEDAEELLPTDHSNTYFANSLRLVVKDGFKGSEHLHQNMKEISELISVARRSGVIDGINNLEDEVEPGCENEWNFTLKMIRSMLSVPEETLKMIKGTPKMSEHNRDILTDMLTILESFEEASECIQQQNSVSASFVIPCVRGLRYHLNHVYSNYNDSLVKDLFHSVEKRLHNYEINEVYQLAAILDPRFKLSWCNLDEEKVDIRCKLAMEAYAMTNTKLTTEAVKQESAFPAKKRMKLFTFMDSSSSESPHKGRQTIDIINTEIQTYLDQACLAQESDPMTYWRMNKNVYPNIAKVAQKYLCVPASFVSIEKSLGTAGREILSERRHMSDQIFEKVLMIKCNVNMI